MKDISIYGAGGHCNAIVELIRSAREYHPFQIVDDAPVVNTILGITVQKSRDSLIENSPMCIAIGNNKVRKQLAEELRMEYPSFVHHSAEVYPSASVGKGTVIFPLAVVDAAVQIGNHCIVNNHATISHNAVIGDYAHIAIQAAVAGGAVIGEGALIGAGSVVLPKVKIGAWATVGAGAVVTKDVPAHATVYGNPAKIR